MLLTLVHQESLSAAEDVLEVAAIAEALRAAMDSAAVRAGLAAIPAVGGTSHQVDAVVRPHAESLGFSQQRRELFADYPVGLRPDWYRPLADSGVILEVERGKTVTNNMDLLDLWKCHICHAASHLFLVVPVRVQRTSGTEAVYARVLTRLGTFFIAGNETNVRSLAVFGYGDMPPDPGTIAASGA